ncbi:MAG: protein kinase [Pseudomonadota bacterium]
MSQEKNFERFGRYLLLHRIAIGGMAEIFLAHPVDSRDPSQLLVIKRIRDDLCHDDSFIEMFIDEARVVSRLSHPNIIQLLEFGQVDGRYFIALEHVWGESLRTMTLLCTKSKMRFPLGAALFIGAETAAALDSAHRQLDETGELSPVIHRDVTMGNVVVSYAGDVKVLDYGIAKAKGRLSQTRAGQIKGTLSYLAPEQLRGQEMGPHTDIYQLGVLLYQTLVGRLPVNGESEGAMMAAIVSGQIVRPSQVVSGFPAAIERVLLKAMAREPVDRYGSAAELEAALREVIQGTPYAEGKQRLAHMITNITGDRRDKQENFLQGLLQGLAVDRAAAESLRWATADDAPNTLSVELSAIMASEDLDDFEDAATIVMPPSEIPDLEAEIAAAASASMPLADADFSDEALGRTEHLRAARSAAPLRASPFGASAVDSAAQDLGRQLTPAARPASAEPHAATTPGGFDLDVIPTDIGPPRSATLPGQAPTVRPGALPPVPAPPPTRAMKPVAAPQPSAARTPTAPMSPLIPIEASTTHPGLIPRRPLIQPETARGTNLEDGAPGYRLSMDGAEVAPGEARFAPGQRPDSKNREKLYDQQGMRAEDFDAILHGYGSREDEDEEEFDLGYDAILGPPQPPVPAVAIPTPSGLAPRATPSRPKQPAVAAPPVLPDSGLNAMELFADLSGVHPASVSPVAPPQADSNIFNMPTGEVVPPTRDTELDAIARAVGANDARGGGSNIVFILALFAGVLVGLGVLSFVLFPDLPTLLLERIQGKPPARAPRLKPEPPPPMKPTPPPATGPAAAMSTPPQPDPVPATQTRLRVRTTPSLPVTYAGQSVPGDARFTLNGSKGLILVKDPLSGFQITMEFDVDRGSVVLRVDASANAVVSSDGIRLGPTPQNVGPGSHISLQIKPEGQAPIGITVSFDN